MGEIKVKITRFEDLECWQEAKLLTRSVYVYAKRVNFSKDLRLSGQITGAAISVMNNICEGFDSKSNREFIRFLTYSRRSCSEVQNCLYVALDQHYISADDFQNTYDHCAKVRKIIDGLIRYLNRPRANRLTGQPTTG
jgi:four helix bundle protein